MKIVTILVAAALASSLAVSSDAQAAGQKKKCYKISASGSALFSGRQGAEEFARAALALEILANGLNGVGKVKISCKEEGIVTCNASQKACK